MLYERLSNYLNTIEQTILTYPGLYIDRYTEEILTRDRADLKTRVRLKQNNLLEINEAMIITHKKPSETWNEGLRTQSIP